MSRMIAALGLVLFVGCPTEKAKPSPAKQAASQQEKAAPVETDFEAEADEEINQENYDDELKLLERAIGGR